MLEQLLKLGLNDNEGAIYIALLSMGPATSINIGKHTKINRSTVYLALSKLIDLGLVIEHYENKKRLFKAEEPAQLKKLTKRMRRKVIQAESLLEDLIPVLEQLPRNGNSEEPRISFRPGINGMKNVLMDVSKSKESWYLFGSSTKVLQTLPPEEMKEILEEGEKLRQTSGRPKIFFITDKGILALAEFSKSDLSRREIKILKQEIKSNSAFIVYEDKVVILNFSRNPFAAIIKSKEVSEVVKIMFQLIWKSLGTAVH